MSLQRYLELEQKVFDLEEQEGLAEFVIDNLRDQMDILWEDLSLEEQELLDSRELI